MYFFLNSIKIDGFLLNALRILLFVLMTPGLNLGSINNKLLTIQAVIVTLTMHNSKLNVMEMLKTRT